MYLTLATFQSVERATFLGLIKRLPCEGIQDSLGFWSSMPWIPVFRYLIPDLLSSELVFRIPMPRIPDCTSTNLFGFRIPQAKLSRIPDFGFPCTGRSVRGFQNPSYTQNP